MDVIRIKPDGASGIGTDCSARLTSSRFHAVGLFGSTKPEKVRVVAVPVIAPPGIRNEKSV